MDKARGQGYKCFARDSLTYWLIESNISLHNFNLRSKKCSLCWPLGVSDYSRISV